MYVEAAKCEKQGIQKAEENEFERMKINRFLNHIYSIR